VMTSDQIDPKNPSGGRAIVGRPSRMDASVAANKRPVVHGESVRVRRVRNESTSQGLWPVAASYLTRPGRPRRSLTIVSSHCQIAPLSHAMAWYRILPGAW